MFCTRRHVLQTLEKSVMEPSITVIIPVYNVEKYVGRCLDSVCASLYRTLEILCIDDGSTDASGEICDRYAQKDDRIRVIHQTNQGLSAARNAGLEAAAGEYIAFVDSDDWIHPAYFQLLLQAAQEEKADLSICLFRHVSSQEDPAELQHPQPRILSLTQFLTDNRMKGFVWGKLYRRDVIGTLRFDSHQKFEDIVFNILLSMDHPDLRVVLIDEILYSYFRREGSLFFQITDDVYARLSAWMYEKALETKDPVMHQILVLESLKRGLWCRHLSVKKGRKKDRNLQKLLKKELRLLRVKKLQYAVMVHFPLVYELYHR